MGEGRCNGCVVEFTREYGDGGDDDNVAVSWIYE